MEIILDIWKIGLQLTYIFIRMGIFFHMKLTLNQKD